MDAFIDHFAEHRDAFVLIGGAACDLWFAEQHLPFRATKDLDLVLILENASDDFASCFWSFIREGDYEEKVRNEDAPPALYRFSKPRRHDYPFMLELFCREVSGLNPGPQQHILPVRFRDAESLSAILLHDSYYRFLLDHCRPSRGILSADGAALIPLKARAWLDLMDRKTRGEQVKGDDIKKHRNDVFRLALTLPANPGVLLSGELAADLSAFLNGNSSDNADWNAIQQSIRPTAGGTVSPETLLDAIRRYYQLGDESVRQ